MQWKPSNLKDNESNSARFPEDFMFELTQDE